MSNSDSDKSTIVSAFVAGAAVGALSALLMAPKSGKETREDIKDKVGDAKDKVASTVSETTDTAKSKISDAVDITRNVAKESKRAAKEAKERAKHDRHIKDAEHPEEEE